MIEVEINSGGSRANYEAKMDAFVASMADSSYSPQIGLLTPKRAKRILEADSYNTDLVNR